jgi:hypothetical protein
MWHPVMLPKLRLKYLLLCRHNFISKQTLFAILATCLAKPSTTTLI